MAVGNLSKRVLDKGLLRRQCYRFIGQHRVDIIFTEAQIGKYLRGMFADQGRPGAANILARDGRCTRYLRDGDGADRGDPKDPTAQHFTTNCCKRR